MRLRLAPYCQGRVLWLEDGISWLERAQAPREGWYWWEDSGRVKREAHESEICDRPLQMRIYESQPDWRLVENFPKGCHLKAWLGGGFYWAVSLQLGPSLKRVFGEASEASGQTLVGDQRRPRAAWAGARLKRVFGEASGQTLFGDQLRVRRPDLSEAVARGGGKLLSSNENRGLLEVHWSSLSRSFRSLVDARLNVIEAGLCLSGQDRIQDLTSLVSLVVREENEGGHFGSRPW